MARRSNSRGYCDTRLVDVFELNLCDYFEGKRKNSKPSCRNCVHFNLIEITAKEEKKKKTRRSIE